MAGLPTSQLWAFPGSVAPVAVLNVQLAPACQDPVPGLHPGPLARSFVAVGARCHTPNGPARTHQALAPMEDPAMRLRACIALLLFLSACTTTPPGPREPAGRDPRLANLQRVAKLPWLWDVKTDDFDKHGRRSQQFFIEVKLPEIQRERRLAEECGYDFAVGVRSETHKTALKRADPTLKVFVMDWC
jgi:uncharacterized protein DUF6310